MPLSSITDFAFPFILLVFSIVTCAVYFALMKIVVSVFLFITAISGRAVNMQNCVVQLNALLLFGSFLW